MSAKRTSNRVSGPTRPGKTSKVSVSLEANDLLTLRERAVDTYGGNLSAAIAEGARRIREEQGREALASWIRETVKPSADDLERIRDEWRSNPPVRRRTR